MSKTEKAVAAKQEQLPAELEEMLGGVDESMENADADSFAIPFLQILQSGSPQVKRGNPKQIEGATEGMLFNTVTGQLYDGELGVNVVPVYYRRGIVEWVSRDEGGGYVAEHTPGSEPPSKRSETTGRDTTENGHELVDTRYHYCLLLKEDGSEADPVVIAMASTGVKKSKNWMFNIQRQRHNGKPVVMRGQVWRLTSTVESKDDYTWCNWETKFVDVVKDVELFKAATEFMQGIRTGALKENPDHMRDDVAPAQEDPRKEAGPDSGNHYGAF